MNQNLFFSSVCNVKTAILEYERDSSLQRHLLQQQKNLRWNKHKQKEKGTPKKVTIKKSLRKAFTMRRRKWATSYSPTTKGSTIGAGGLNFSVRDGKRWDPAAIVTVRLYELNWHGNTTLYKIWHEKEHLQPWDRGASKSVANTYLSKRRGVCKCIPYSKTSLRTPKSVCHKKTQESLVLVGCDVTIDTPLAYQRSRLLRLLGETSS